MTQVPRHIRAEAEPQDRFILLHDGTCDLFVASPTIATTGVRTANLLEAPPDDHELVVLTQGGQPSRATRIPDSPNSPTSPTKPPSPTARCKSHFHSLYAETGFEPDIVDATDDHLSVRSLITSGLGVVMISSFVASVHAARPGIRLPVPTHGS